MVKEAVLRTFARTAVHAGTNTDLSGKGGKGAEMVASFPPELAAADLL